MADTMSHPPAELVALLSARIRESGLVRRPASDATPATRCEASVGLDEPLAAALSLMLREQCHRLTVRDEAAAGGSLDALDLLDWITSPSGLGGSATASPSLEALAHAARQVDDRVMALHAGGVGVEAIARLASQLNRRIFERLWSLVASPELQAASCLLVMGSEGRGEQLLRTDQDNALLLRDGVDPALAEAAAMRFNRALADFGYPPCDGEVMVSNPLWRQPISSFRDTIRDWVYGSDPEGTMRLAIFVDARVVAGDGSLLEEARAWLNRILSDNAAWLARFASAIDLFPEPSGWWTRLATLAGLEEPPLDLKKHGSFPIVHGVRSLALEHRITATSTAERLRQLVLQLHLPAELGRDLGEVLALLSRLKLQNHLRQRSAGEPLSHRVRPAELSLLDRNGLHESLAVVQQFRQLLHHHFHMEAL